MTKLRDSALSMSSQVEVYGRPDPETGRETALCDSYADRRAIKNHVNCFARAVRRDCEKVLTLAVVIFVGHGTAHTECEFKYIASDYNESDPNTRVLGSDIEAPLRGLRCSRLLIFDCCQSGLIAQSMSLSTDQANRDLAATASAFARTVPFRFVLTSCQANQLAWEHPDWQAGLMTRSILDVLDDPGACRANGILNLAVLKSKVKEVMDLRAAEKNLTQEAVVDFPDSASEAIPLRYSGRRLQ